MLSFDVLASVVASSLLVYLWWRHYQARTTYGCPLPPGPKKLPLVGNLLDMPKGLEWEAYARWGKQYNSPIIHMDIAGMSLVVVNTAEAANDLFEKRGGIYSSRVRMPMINELMGWSFDFAFMPYGSEWRACRRIFHQEFHPVAALRFCPQVLKSTHYTLHQLLDSPENFMSHLRHLAGKTIMSVAYGIDILPQNDPYIEYAIKGVFPTTIAGIPGAFLVDSIPILKYVPAWLPGAGFKRQAKEWHKWTKAMLEIPFEAAKRNIDNGCIAPSFISYRFARIDEKGDVASQERLIKETAAVMYAAGSDTTVAAFGTFFLAMLINPEAQLKAQKELDTVLGHGQLPDFDDQDSLPYVTAIVKEVLRWKPVLPLAIPHALTVEDVYMGYRIPAGSMVVGNTWAILQDETMYPDPSNFNPERFLRDGTLNPDIKDPETAIFGYGRRICPGRYLASAAVWIAIASVLATFDITKAVDEDGATIEPSQAYLNNLVCYPLPFKCSIKPRSRKAENSVRDTVIVESL